MGNFIRVNADQVTYLAHILVRYEIEKQIMNGGLKVEDIPDAWNELMKKFLGIVPGNLTEGCLQDIHWSHGLIGYFPTYQVGNWLAAMIETWILREGVIDEDGRFGMEDMAAVLGFLAKRYYIDAPVLTTLDAFERVSGSREIDLEPWKRHQTTLVDEVYGLS